MTKTNATDNVETYLTVRQLADFLVVSERTVRRWIADRQLKVVRLGRSVRISKTELDHFVRERSD